MLSFLGDRTIIRRKKFESQGAAGRYSPQSQPSCYTFKPRTAEEVLTATFITLPCDRGACCSHRSLFMPGAAYRAVRTSILNTIEKYVCQAFGSTGYYDSLREHHGTSCRPKSHSKALDSIAASDYAALPLLLFVDL